MVSVTNAIAERTAAQSPGGWCDASRDERRDPHDGNVVLVGRAIALAPLTATRHGCDGAWMTRPSGRPPGQSASPVTLAAKTGRAGSTAQVERSVTSS